MNLDNVIAFCFFNYGFFFFFGRIFGVCFFAQFLVDDTHRDSIFHRIGSAPIRPPPYCYKSIRAISVFFFFFFHLGISHSSLVPHVHTRMISSRITVKNKVTTLACEFLVTKIDTSRWTRSVGNSRLFSTRRLLKWFFFFCKIAR